MRRILFFILLTTVTKLLSAQAGYSVHYQHDNRIAPVTFNGEKNIIKGPVDRLVFRDSLSLCYRLADGYDPYKKKQVFGEKSIHHAILYNAVQDVYFSEVAWPANKPKLLIRDTLKNESWTFLPENKEILGQLCSAALRVNERGDSTLVWYSKNISAPFGPFFYMGFPGLVMEVSDQSNGWHLLATKLVPGDFIVRMPEDATIVDAKDFRKTKR